jgi:hypothetical protein
MVPWAGFFNFDRGHQPLGDHLFEQRGLAAEVVTNRAGTHAGACGNVSQGGALVTILTEGKRGTVEDLAPANVGPTLPPGLALQMLYSGYPHWRLLCWLMGLTQSDKVIERPNNSMAYSGYGLGD